ncbi:MAG TPA: M4 family metallopeptidase [Arenibacter sp.]|nr:M4 family metallopeptidase [Arenibacter sp.]
MLHRSRPYFVPPYILEQLAKQGSTYCKRTLLETQRIAEARNNVLNGLLRRQDQEGTGERLVYDSLNKYQQQVKLVRKEGDTGIGDRSVDDAFDLSGYVRDYFKNTFLLNSLDGRGMPILSNVHYGKGYNNAFWDGDEITYGDGDGIQFTNFSGGIDVVGHELAHGVTQFLGNLEYKGQSGALNEHFSDIFATTIKQKYLGQDVSNADWLIGDTVVTKIFPGKAIRSLKAPGTANEFDRQPDHMDQYYDGASDNYGVHINSEIPNKAFYLSCLAIGIKDCALIWFETLRNLWRTANFNDMFTVIMKVSTDLIAEQKISPKAPPALSESFSAVGIVAVTT